MIFDLSALCVLAISFVLKRNKKLRMQISNFFSSIMTISYMQSGVCQSILLPCLVYQLFYVDFFRVIIVLILK